DVLRSVDRYGDGDAHAPGTKCIGNARDAADQLRREDTRVGIDIVHRASVDADGGEQPAVVADPAEVVAHGPVLEEDGEAAVAALDAAVQVVPLIDPADRRGGRLAALHASE